MMRVGEVHPAALVDDLRLQKLGQLDQEPHAVLAARGTIGDDHRVLRIGEKPRRLFHGAAIALRRRGGHVARNVELFAVVADGLLLQAGIERDGDRSIGRRHRDLVRTHEGLREMLQRDWRVVPLGEISHQRVDVLRGVDGRHPRRPMRGIEIVAADHDQGYAIAPGVVDGHRCMLQADRAVTERHQRLAGDLEVAVRHGDRGFLVRAGEKFRHLVAAVVDQRLVDGAEARSRVRRQIFDIEGLDDVDHEVGAGNAADPRSRQVLRRSALGRRHVHRRRQRGRPSRGGGRGRRGRSLRRRHRARRARHRDSGQELAPTHLRTRMFSCHGVSPLMVMRGGAAVTPAQ